MDQHLSRRGALKLSAALGVSAISTRALSAPHKVDTLITGGYVHTMDAGRTYYRNGAVAIDGRKIVAVGPAHLLKEQFSAKSVVDASGKMVLPGLFDNHLHPALVVPIAPPGDEERLAVYPGVEGAFEKRSPGPFARGGDVEANFKWLLPLSRHGYDDEESYYYALNSFMIAASAGTTCFVDGGAGQTRSVARAQLDIGLRGNLSRVAYDMLIDPADRTKGLQRVEDSDKVLREAEQLFKELHGRGDGLLHFWFNFFLDQTSSDALVQGAAALARQYKTGLCSHSAAGYAHDEYSRAHFGQATFDRFERLGVLGPNWLGAHMGHVTEADIPRLKHYDCKIVHAPGTTLFGGKGYISHSKIFPKLVDAGVAVSLGSDTANRGVALVEAQRAFAAHKDAWEDNRVFPAYTIARMLTSRGAACAQRPDCGTLEVGKSADIAIVDIDNPRYDGADPLAAMLYVGYPSDVSSTMVDGRFIYRNREFQTIDADKVQAEVRRINARRIGRQPQRPS